MTTRVTRPGDLLMAETRPAMNPATTPLAATKPGYDYGDEFEYGLDLILDRLKRVRDLA